MPVKLCLRFMPSGSLEKSSGRCSVVCRGPPPNVSLIGVRALELDMLAWKAWEKSFGGAIGALICGIE